MFTVGEGRKNIPKMIYTSIPAAISSNTPKSPRVLFCFQKFFLYSLWNLLLDIGLIARQPKSKKLTFR